MEVFLDLEGVVIEDFFFNNTSINKNLFDTISKDFSNANFHIFSFAICDDKDLERFNKIFKERIEKEFDIKICSVVKKEDVLSIVKKRIGVSILDEFEMTTFFGKHFSFFHFCEENMIDGILFDDAVPNDKMIIKTEKVTVEIVRVEKFH